MGGKKTRASICNFSLFKTLPVSHTHLEFNTAIHQRTANLRKILQVDPNYDAVSQVLCDLRTSSLF